MAGASKQNSNKNMCIPKLSAGKPLKQTTSGINICCFRILKERPFMHIKNESCRM